MGYKVWRSHKDGRCTSSAQKVRKPSKLYPMLFGAWALGPAGQRALSIGYVSGCV